MNWMATRLNPRQLRMLERLQQSDDPDGSVPLGLDVLRGGGARTLDALIATGLVEFVRIETMANRYRLTAAGARVLARDAQRTS
jgi:hypothetical protein